MTIDEDVEFDTGPFCPHWASPEDCDEKCARCAHECRRHGMYGDGSCYEEGCECEHFVNEEKEDEEDEDE